jgi:hypothetical protein
LLGTRSFITQTYVEHEASLPRIMWNPKLHYPELCETQSFIDQNYVELKISLPRIVWNPNLRYPELYGNQNFISQTCVEPEVSLLIIRCNLKFHCSELRRPPEDSLLCYRRQPLDPVIYQTDPDHTASSFVVNIETASGDEYNLWIFLLQDVSCLVLLQK